MNFRLLGILLGGFGVLAIVYLDMAIATTPYYATQFADFPLIYLIVFPLILIALCMAWGKLPSPS